MMAGKASPNFTIAADNRRAWFVLWGHTAHSIGDHAVNQAQTIIRVLVIGPFGKAKVEQSFIEKITGPIASEGAASAISTAQTWRQTDNQQARGWGGETGDGGIMPIGLGCAIFKNETAQARA